jgi:hypothetical protein
VGGLGLDLFGSRHGTVKGSCLCGYEYSESAKGGEVEYVRG